MARLLVVYGEIMDAYRAGLAARVPPRFPDWTGFF